MPEARLDVQDKGRNLTMGKTVAIKDNYSLTTIMEIMIRCCWYTEKGHPTWLWGWESLFIKGNILMQIQLKNIKSVKKMGVCGQQSKGREGNVRVELRVKGQVDCE